MPERPDPSRARAALLAAGALFALGQLGVGLLLDRAPMDVRFAQGAKLLASADRMGGRPYALLLGSSRLRNVDVGELRSALAETLGSGAPPVLQGSVLAGDPIVADHLLERILARGGRPALVILEISPETLSTPAHWVDDHATRFFTWRDVAAWAPEILAAGQARKVLATRLLPVHVYRKELLGWLVGHPPPYLAAPGPGAPASAHPFAAPASWTPALAPPPEPDERTLSGLARMREWLDGYRLGGGSLRSLERALERCRHHGVAVVLLDVPATSWLRALYTPEIEGPYRETMARLAATPGVRFLDYRTRIPDGLFEDHYHLDEEGGRVFGRMLAREVIAPAWPGRSPAPLALAPGPD